MSKLPIGWTAVRLAEVAEINPKETGPAKASTRVSFVPMPAVSEREGKILAHGTRPFKDVAKGYTRFRDGDVLFAKITPCMENGKVALASGLSNGFGCGTTEFHVLRPSAAILGEYLWRFLRQKAFRVEAERHMTGAVGQRRVPAQFIKEAVLNLPPLEEQRQILHTLNRLFAHSERAGSELGRLPRLVKRYRQALIGEACRGEPTKLSDIVTDVRYGTARKCHYEPTKNPVLRIPNVVNGRVDVGDLKYGTFSVSECQKLALVPGDILIIRSNGSLDIVGRAALISSEVAGYLFAGYLIRLRFDLDRAHPPYVMRTLESLAGRAQLEGFAKSTSGVQNINSEQLRDLTIPLPVLEEQQRVAARLDATLSSFERLEVGAHRAAELTARLEQAALGRAFAGRLPQSEKRKRAPREHDLKPAELNAIRAVSAKRELGSTPAIEIRRAR